jgi:breast cancer 2 susceptibility protein
MVLCVSDILNNGSSGSSASGQPQLEVTDGWYRLKMEIDAPLIRAINRGRLRIGQKIVVAGAYVSMLFYSHLLHLLTMNVYS